VGGPHCSHRAGRLHFRYRPHLLPLPQIPREIFAACGFDFDAMVPMTRLDPMYRLRFEDGRTFDATPDVERLKAEVARSTRGRGGRRALPRREPRKFEAFRPVLQKPFLHLGAFADMDMVRRCPPCGPGRRWTRTSALVPQPGHAARLLVPVKYLGMSPFKCPSLFTILAHIEYGHGVFHPIGRLQRDPARHGQALARWAWTCGWASPSRR
jgi:phytoene desaturase